MIARVHAGGGSFTGALAYVSHDKNRKTTERVGFLDVLNMVPCGNDPAQAAARAARIMAATTYLAPALKQLAGVPGGGRRLAKPVYHYSLNWPPDENPAREEMRAAAESSLTALGMDDRQAVIVEHRDRKHSHVHIVVNRVSPEDGRAASAGQDQIKLKNWAREYERDQVRCPRRIDWSIKPQRREGPDRMPRSRAHRRAWSNLYSRQRRQCSREGRSKELDQLHLLQRAKLARKHTARHERRLELRAAVTEAKTRIGATTAAIGTATTAAIGTVARKVAAAITPEPRTDAERTRIALDHINHINRPGILPRLAAAGSAALSVVPAVAAGARAVITAVAKPRDAEPSTTGLSAELANSRARMEANEHDELRGTPAAELAAAAAELAAAQARTKSTNRELSESLLESSEQQRKRLRDRLFADEKPNQDQVPTTASTSLAADQPPLSPSTKRPAAAAPLPASGTPPVSSLEPLTLAAAQAAQALVDQPKSAELVKKLLDTLPENHKKTFLLETLDRKMNPEIPARTIVAAFKFQSPREWGLHLGRELVSEIQERRRRAEERKVDEEQQRADKAKARTAARSTSPSTAPSAPKKRPEQSPAPTKARTAARSTSPSTAPSAPKKRPEQSPAPTAAPKKRPEQSPAPTVRPSPSATPEQQETYRKLSKDGRMLYYLSLEPGVTPGQETSEQIDQAFDRFRPRPSQTPDPAPPVPESERDRGRGGRDR